MRDIVETIQREQDEIIRAPLEGVVVVQGGPGTGKTAVALHRAAYLLYAHRERLERLGVLVIGPNAVFLRYIEQVLPTLGETATLTSIGGLVRDVDVTAHDPPERARVKGDDGWRSSSSAPCEICNAVSTPPPRSTSREASSCSASAQVPTS